MTTQYLCGVVGRRSDDLDPYWRYFGPTCWNYTIEGYGMFMLAEWMGRLIFLVELWGKGSPTMRILYPSIEAGHHGKQMVFDVMEYLQVRFNRSLCPCLIGLQLFIQTHRPSSYRHWIHNSDYLDDEEWKWFVHHHSFLITIKSNVHLSRFEIDHYQQDSALDSKQIHRNIEDL